MSYNSERAKNFYRNTSKRRVPPPGAGIKRSEIRRESVVRARNLSSESAVTAHGVASALFDGSKFSVKLETMGAGNNTGLQATAKGERFLFMISGGLFVRTITETGDQNGEVREGEMFAFPKGQKYSLATSNHDVTFLSITSKNYDKFLVHYGEEVVTKIVEQVVDVNMTSGRRTDRTAALRAKKAMEKNIVRTKKSGPIPVPVAEVGVGNNSNSSAVEGVNPMPVMPVAE